MILHDINDAAYQCSKAGDDAIKAYLEGLIECHIYNRSNVSVSKCAHHAVPNEKITKTSGNYYNCGMFLI